MVGGASSRMKKSLEKAAISPSQKDAARTLHKSLIPLGEEQRPLLYYLLKNAAAANINRVYLITSKENDAFKDALKGFMKVPPFHSLEINFAVQHLKKGSYKPLGTADALQQCMEQYPQLMKEHFIVCNGDNLYSSGAFLALQRNLGVANGLIAYEGAYLGHSEEKLAKFALLDFNKEGVLTDILEKPNTTLWEAYKKRHKALWISMNIFCFYGEAIYPFLVNCELNPQRNEKELPMAVRNMMKSNRHPIRCIQRAEKIPDLTAAQDILTFDPNA